MKTITSTESTKYLLVTDAGNFVLAESPIYPHLAALIQPGTHIERETTTVQTITIRAPYTPPG